LSFQLVLLLRTESPAPFVEKQLSALSFQLLAALLLLRDGLA
jgi:hypothetical protein